jgi:RNA polymerase sigma-70 factor (ECF subfamily)
MNATPADSPLQVLLTKLRQGDAAAAAELFRTYEPTLRLVVRRQLSRPLRAKFDSADIVQSVWADVLHRFQNASWTFKDADQLRGFLVTATRHRFIDRYRQHRGALAREQPLAAQSAEAALRSHQPRPSEEAQAHDLWQQMLDLCPSQHHELLELKRQGLPLAEIAQRTGLHQSSVRRVLYDLARKLAFRQGKLAAEDDR